MIVLLEYLLQGGLTGYVYTWYTVSMMQKFETYLLCTSFAYVWARSQPMREDVTYVKSSLIG